MNYGQDGSTGGGNFAPGIEHWAGNQSGMGMAPQQMMPWAYPAPFAQQPAQGLPLAMPPPPTPAAPQLPPLGSGLSPWKPSPTPTASGPPAAGPQTKKKVDLSHLPDMVRTRFKAFHDKFQGRGMFSITCQAAGVSDMSTLPVIKKYIDGETNNLCYNRCLGICGHGDKCHFHHASKEEQEKEDGFCQGICDKLGPGADWLVRNGLPAPGGKEGGGRGRGRGRGKGRGGK